VYALDGFSIAREEASDAELRYRMQGAAFMGAFFAVAPFMSREGLDETRLFEGIGAQLQRKFGKLGERVVADNVRVIRRGFDEVREVRAMEEATEGAAEAPLPAPASHVPELLDVPTAGKGIGNPGRFFEQVCGPCLIGQDGIADPFAAISAIPAATSSIRDMTNIRFEVPRFLPEKCTGCSQCWVQCPDSAIPGLVSTAADLWETAIGNASAGHSVNRIRSISRHLAQESHKLVSAVPFTSFGEVASAAYRSVVDRLGWDAERRAELDEEFAAVYPALAEFPVARTAPFFEMPESRQAGSGGLLSITIDPEACKGCNICVDVCPEDALVTVRQDEAEVERLRRNWDFWKRLPDTDERYVNVRSVDEGIGVLSSLLLKKDVYRSMVGGDGACMGCGEKTAVHLVTSAIVAMMQPRAQRFVARLEDLRGRLEARARTLLAADADLDVASLSEAETLDLPLPDTKREALLRLVRSMAEIADLRWRYVEGPGGRGRAALGIANSTGCSSVWGSTYPYNPYPFPWVNHLFQDAPSIAIGIFEGQMRKMADAFTAVRRAELLADGSYDADAHEPALRELGWQRFTDEEFGLCPPLLAIGGDGAMLDIGFQNLSRLMASGKPIRVVVLDTQVYSNTGGQACTSGFTGQVADMSAYGKAHHGKEEVRKELALIAIAHRGVFVHQSSQASASHLLGGLLRGLQSRRPAVFNLYTPCPVEHGLPDDWAPHAARLALESRAFPLLTYDPDAGDTLAECLSLEGNPAVEEPFPTYELEYVDEGGESKRLELPLTIADWAATESRFKKHFRTLPADVGDDGLVPFHEYVALPATERDGKTAFVYTIDDGRRLARLSVAPEIAELAADRLSFWSQLRQLAGLEVPTQARQAIEVDLEREFERRSEALRREHEAELAELRASFPAVIARRLAEGLLRGGGGNRTVGELLEAARSAPDLEPVRIEDLALASAEPRPVRSEPVHVAAGNGNGIAAPAASPASEVPVASAPAAVEEALGVDPWIETARCTTCNECTNLNSRMFAYDDNKQAYIRDPRAGTFAQLVTAAERCAAGLIHPGSPLNPGEKDLEKWIARAAPFN
jgi:pyruvate-ferredoxin/flavodoxin oxidoreductase